MKPIRLDIAGLNSFRSRVSIDFAPLLRDGLFGIFGPTGSGKSTILDAMTLALYGTVARSGSKGGFINEREPSCTVSFTFEIASGGDRERFTVERTFRRSKGGGTEAHKLRLSEHDPDGNLVPVAEKGREVNERIAEILGISADDFTRAVVLPQGAFSNFLALKPADRSRMLERLFDLEHLGERLTKTLRSRRDRISSDIRLIEERLAILAEYDDAAVVELVKHASQAENESRAAAESARRSADAHHHARVLFDLITELDELRGSEQERETSRARISEIQTELDRADRARNLLPLIEATAVGETRKREAEEVHRQMRAAFDQASSVAERAARALEEIAPLEQDRLPLLEEQRRELEKTRKTRKALDIERATLEKSEADLANATGELKKLQEEAAADERSEAVLRDEMEKFRDDEKENAISEADRKRISDLEDVLKDRRQLGTTLDTRKAHHAAEEKALAELQTVIDEKKRERARRQLLAAEKSEAVTSLEQTLVELTKKASGEKETADRLAHGMAELDRLDSEVQTLARKEIDDRRRLDERNGELTRLTNQGQKARDERDGLEKSLARKREEYELMAHQDALATLSENLHDGHNCPLCGSPHHPYPFHERPKDRVQGVDAVSKEALQDLESRLKKAVEDLATVTSDFRAKRDEMKGMETALEERTKELQEKRKTLAIRLRVLLADDEEQTIDYARARRNEAAQQVEALSNEIESRAARLKKETEERNELTARVQALDVELANDGGLLKGKQQDLRREADTIATESQRLKEIDDVIAQRATKGDIYGAEREVEDFRTRDARLLDLRVKIDDHRRRKDELDDKIRALRVRLDETRRRHDRLDGDVSRLRESIAETDREVRRVLAAFVDRERQDLPIETLISDITDEIDRLKKKIDQHRIDVQQSQVKRARAEADCVNAEENLNRAAKDCEQVRIEADEAMRNAGYSSAEAARKDALEESQVRVLRTEMQTLTTALEIARKRTEELADSIGDRSMSTSDFERLASEAERLRAAADERTKEFNVLQARLNTAREKNAQWREARDAKGKEGELASRYERLERYLRGNGFVNFVANEHLSEICRRATRTLESLTGGRYAVMARGSDGFVIGDNRLGAERLPGTLSGGETFLVSLALAIALSDTLQFERRPLEFFFLDEGFGALDAELLETVIDALERLASPNRAIGVISHLTALRERIEHKLIVVPSAGIEGARVEIGG